MKSKKQTVYKRLYIKENIILWKGREFEHLYGRKHKYREIFSSDDYDYVEDEMTIRILDLCVNAKKIK